MQREKELKVLSKDDVSKRLSNLRYVEASQVPATIKCGADEVFVGFVCGGSVKFSVQGVGYKATRNMIFVQRGADVTDVRCSKAFYGYFITAKTSYITSLNIDTADYIVTDMIARTKPTFEADDLHAEMIISLASRIVSLSQEKGILLRDKVVNSLTEAYFYMIVSIIGNKHVEDVSMRRNSSIIVLNRFYDLLKENYTRERSVEYYALQLGISPKYLSMVCRQYRGLTASNIIDGAVIRHAKMLLKQHGVSVQDVAKMLNFTSQSFFGKYFKQRVGVSPSRYKGGN